MIRIIKSGHQTSEWTDKMDEDGERSVRVSIDKTITFSSGSITLKLLSAESAPPIDFT